MKSQRQMDSDHQVRTSIYKDLYFASLFSSSYGSVFKAIHKESGQVVAIKQVPVESDLQEIIKEISIMQQCDRYGWVKTTGLRGGA